MGIMEKLRLDGKKIFVTGGARGIGMNYAQAVAEAGADVAIVDMDLATAQATAERLAAETGRTVIAVQADVTDPASVDAMMETILAQFGRLDAAFCNAGICINVPAEEMSYETWKKVIDVNLKGTFLFTRAVSRPMMKNKAEDGTQLGGAIINLASVVGIMGNAGQANYTASKGGVISLTKTTAKELGSRNIRCNAVAPGFIQSKMTDVLPDDVKKSYMDTIPLKRFGTAEDIANCVAFLVSPAAEYITGQVISVNGGMIG